jgi:hypothetical protein
MDSVTLISHDDLPLARSTCAAVASLADFTIDRIADVQLAVAESLGLFAGGASRIAFTREAAEVAVRIDGQRAAGESTTELTRRILTALCDEARIEPDGEGASIHLRFDGGAR